MGRDSVRCGAVRGRIGWTIPVHKYGSSTGLVGAGRETCTPRSLLRAAFCCVQLSASCAPAAQTVARQLDAEAQHGAPLGVVAVRRDHDVGKHV